MIDVAMLGNTIGVCILTFYILNQYRHINLTKTVIQLYFELHKQLRLLNNRQSSINVIQNSVDKPKTGDIDRDTN